jgi:hypothetical protein
LFLMNTHTILRHKNSIDRKHSRALIFARPSA